jgi:hypothetical protein
MRVKTIDMAVRDYGFTVQGSMVPVEQVYERFRKMEGEIKRLMKATHEMAGLISTSPNYADKHPSAVLADFGVLGLCQAIDMRAKNSGRSEEGSAKP